MPTESSRGSSALLSSLGTALALAAAFIVPSELIRCLASRTLRRRVFEPRLARRGALGSAIRECPPWPLSWLLIAYSTDDTEQAVLDEIGLDAAVYIGTVRLGLRIILATAWFDLGIVLPLNLRGGYVIDGGVGVNDLDRLTIAHVPPQSTLLWAHCFSVLLKTAVTLALLDRFSAFVLAQQMRARRTASSESPAQRTVLVTHVPCPSGEWDVRSKFDAWYDREAISAVTPVVNDAALAPLVAEKEALARDIHRAEKAIARGEARPTVRVPRLSQCGEQVDALDFSTELLLECTARLAAARQAVCAQPPSAAHACRVLRRAAFVTFASERQASVAAQVVHACDSSLWKVGPAPEPGNVFWPNCGRYDAATAQWLQAASWAMTLLLCGFYVVPAGAIQSLTFLPQLARYLPFLGFLQRLKNNPATQSVVEGVLPVVLLTLLAWLWPLFLRMLTIWQGAPTLADIDRGQMVKSYMFNVLIAFLSTVFGGALFAGLHQFVHEPQHTPQLLAVKIPATSRFFLCYVILQGIGTSGPLVARWWQALQYSLRGERKGDGQWPLFPQPFGRLFPHVLLQIQILVIFSSIAPVMQAVSLLYFLPTLGVAKTKMFWHHEPRYEGLGSMWPLVRSCVVGVLLIYQVTLAGLLGLKRAIFPSWIVGICVFPTLLFALRMSRRYHQAMLGAVPVEVQVERQKKGLNRRRQSAAALAQTEEQRAALAAAPVIVCPAQAAAPPGIALPYLHPALADPALTEERVSARYSADSLDQVLHESLLLSASSFVDETVRGQASRLWHLVPRCVKSVFYEKAEGLHEGPSSVGSDEEADADSKRRLGVEERSGHSTRSPPRSMTELRASIAAAMSRHAPPPSFRLGLAGDVGAASTRGDQLGRVSQSDATEAKDRADD